MNCFDGFLTQDILFYLPISLLPLFLFLSLCVCVYLLQMNQASFYMFSIIIWRVNKRTRKHTVRTEKKHVFISLKGVNSIRNWKKLFDFATQLFDAKIAGRRRHWWWRREQRRRKRASERWKRRAKNGSSRIIYEKWSSSMRCII